MRPVVDVLGREPVDGAEVRQVEAPFRDAFDGPLGRKSPLGSVEESRVGDPELVTENG